MIGISIGKSGFVINQKAPFDVIVLSYGSKRCIIDMTKPVKVCTGSYITDNVIPSSSWIDTVVKKVNTEILGKSYIVFDTVNIDRELSKIEKDGEVALSKFVGQELTKGTVRINTVFEQVNNFIESLQTLKDKEKVKIMLPVDVDNIFFLVMDDTEEDTVLRNEAKQIDSWESPTKLKFNLYKLWK